MPEPRPAPRAPRPSERLLLALGGAVALGTGVFWTVSDWARDGAFVADGLLRAAGVLAATLALILVVRLVGWAETRVGR